MTLQVGPPYLSVGSLYSMSQLAHQVFQQEVERCLGRSGWWMLVVVGQLDDMRRWGLKDAEFSWDMREKKEKMHENAGFHPHSRNMSYMWSSTEVHHWSMLKKLLTNLKFETFSLDHDVFFSTHGCPGWWKCSTYHDILQDVYNLGTSLISLIPLAPLVGFYM